MLRKLLCVTAFLGLAGLSVAYAQPGGINDLTNAHRDIQIKRVYNQDAVTHATGTVVVYVGYPTATYPGLSVSTTNTPYDGAFAGVVYGKTLPASDWGYIQIQGYNPAVYIGSATAMGDRLWTSATTGYLAAHTGVDTASESLKAVGVALSVNASSTTIPVLLFGR